MKDTELKAPELSDVELEIEKLALQGLRNANTETGELSEIILNSMGMTRRQPGGGDFNIATVGPIRRMNTDEYRNTLDDVSRQNYDNLTLQLDRQGKALRGELPVSEGLSQNIAKEFEIFKENNARLGNQIIGDDPASATSNTTAGTQALKAFRDSVNLSKDTERRNEIQVGQSNINANRGLISDLENSDITAGLNFPRRNLFALDPSVANSSTSANKSIFNAQANAQKNSDLYNLIGVGGGIGLSGLLRKLIP